MQFKNIEDPYPELDLIGLPWIDDEFGKSLTHIVSFLCKAYNTEVSRIGLYGSWQRGDAGTGSDVDLVVFLNHEVSWFNAKSGIVNRSIARKDRHRWHVIEQEANSYRLDSKVYSIIVVTQGMLDYYTSQGPVHLQNWAHALAYCHILWGVRLITDRAIVATH